MKRLFFTIFAISVLFSCNGEKSLTVTVKNSENFARKNESVEVPITKLKAKFGENIDNLAVYDGQNEIVSQFVDGALLFQASTDANSSKSYILKLSETKTDYEPMAYGRLVPERMDDWCWENNRIAFRVYGPALQATGEISNGIDIWVKRTDKLIVDKWYAHGNYHKDNGEGLDGYKVGRTLGAGALAPIVDGKFVLGNNFISAKLVDSGAIRTSVLLEYAPYDVDGIEVKESRLISLDANSHFNRVTSNFIGKFDEIDAGIGIILRKGDGEIKEFDEAICYSEPVAGKNGVTHIAVVLDDNLESETIQNHITALTKIENGKGYTYLTGAGWSKYGFESNLDWQNYVKQVEKAFNSPLELEFK
ncbi:MAG: DUF4861 family protein [Rikenellaceae bacterium]